jgi:alpha-1,2-mannosyltransferase
MADVVAGLYLRDGKVLLGLRKPTGKRGGLWECPGGKVDPGETHMAALCREWREELGVEITAWGQAGGERIAAALLDLEVCFTVTLYAVHAVQGEPQSLDHVELRWVDLAYAIEYMPCSPAMYAHWPVVRQWLKTRL